MIGDADLMAPSNLIGLNSRKRSEWEAWNAYRGVSKKDAQKMLINSLIAHGVLKDGRSQLGKAFDDFAEKHEFLNYQKALPTLIVAWICLK
jgi:hypothetical protein